MFNFMVFNFLLLGCVIQHRRDFTSGHGKNAPRHYINEAPAIYFKHFFLSIRSLGKSYSQSRRQTETEFYQ